MPVLVSRAHGSKNKITVHAFFSQALNTNPVAKLRGLSVFGGPYL